jgi:putative restriction endonuclease
MRRFWWVNHKKTFWEEIRGGCLWSPQRERNGARNPAYENMRRIAPGDVITSYAYKQNRYVGRATDYAAAANAPLAFAEKAEAWDRSGWYVPVDWTALPKAVEHRTF